MCPMSQRLLRPRATGFNPKSISGLAGWWDAGVLSSLAQLSTGSTAVAAGNDPVGYWADLSGNGRNLTQDATNNRPLYIASELNGRPALDFDGQNDSLSVSFTLSQPTTIFLVGGFETTTGAGSTQLFDGFAAGNRMRLFMPSATTVALFAGAQLTSGSLTPTGSFIYESVFNGASSLLARNGATLNTGNAGTGVPNGIRLAVFGGGTSNFTDCKISELLLFNKILSASETASVRRYLSRKFGITVS